MVFPDLFKEQESCAFGIDGGMHRDEVRALGYTVDNVHNCVIAWDSGSLTMKLTLITSHGASGVYEGWSSPIGC
jgi:hypothetical protein